MENHAAEQASSSADVSVATAAKGSGKGQRLSVAAAAEVLKCVRGCGRIGRNF